jgi:hypothetical protein
MEVIWRFKPVADPLARQVESMIYILKAPMLGWREAARGLKLAEYTPTVEAGGVPKGGELMAIAKSMEGGASPEAFFQSLKERVQAELARGVGLYVEAAGALATSSIILAVFASLPFLGIGPLGLMVMVTLTLVALMMRPGDHYYTLTPLDIVGLMVGITVGFLNLAGGFLAYGLVTLPVLIDDWRVASGLRDRVTLAFGELLTRPKPREIIDTSPVEAGLRRLWLEAKASGAPSLVAWANQLVVHYLEGLQTVKVNYMVYGIIVASFLGGLSLAIPMVLSSVLNQAPGALQMLQAYLNINALKYSEYLNAIGVGLLSGSMMLDHRLGAILAGSLGLITLLL